MEKMILFCKELGKQCDEKGFSVKVGNVKHIFCCENGFKLSIEEFQKQIKTEGFSSDDIKLN